MPTPPLSPPDADGGAAERGELDKLRRELEELRIRAEGDRRAREEERKAREEAEKREEEARKARELAEKREEGGWQEGMRRRWPPNIGRMSNVELAPSSTSHTNPTNAPATAITADVPLAIQSFSHAEASEGAFQAALSRKAVTTEGDTVPLVDGVVLDVIAALGLDLRLRAEKRFDGVKPDSWVVCSRHGLPVGVVEVKKPPKKHNEKPLESEKVLGEVFDALRVLRDRWGVRPAVAILATAWEWRLLWWDGDEEWGAMGVTRPADAPSGDGSQRELGASQIITWEDSGRRTCVYKGARFSYTYEVHPAVDLVAGALRAMDGSAPEIPRDDPFRDADQRAFARLNSETRADWVMGVGSSGADWKWDQMPGRNVVRLIVVAPLGSGRDGSVFLVGHAGSRTVGVLKWTKCSDGEAPRTCQEVAERETANWVAAYGEDMFPDVRCGVWDGGHAVLLPYLKPLDGEAERRAALDNGDVRRALEAMAARRFRHDDVEWRHVARRVRWGGAGRQRLRTRPCGGRSRAHRFGWRTEHSGRRGS